MAQPTNGATATRPSRDQVLADLTRMAEGGEPAEDEHGRETVEPKPGKKSAAAPIDDDEDEHGLGDDDDDQDEDKSRGAASDEDDDEDEDDEDDDEADPDEDEDDEEDKPSKDESPAKDDALARRLAKVKKSEARSREMLARDRTAFESERTKWQAEKKELAADSETLKRLRTRVRYEPDAVLAELGLDEEGFEVAARAAYARSKAGAADPKNREHAARMAKEREANDKWEATQKELADLRKELAQKEQQSTFQQRMTAYVETVAKAAGDATPLLQHALTKNPSKTRARLAEITADLAEKKGAVPSAAKVAKRFERLKREELEDGGIDLAEHLAKLTKKPAAAAAGKKATATMTEAKKPDPAESGGKKKTREEIRDDLERELNALHS